MNRLIQCLAATAVMLACASNAGADKPDHFPRLAAEAKDVAGFIPKGWKLLQRAEGELKGDLNKDGLEDLVAVIEKKTTTSPGDDGSPRILFIAFQKPGGGYTLSVQANKAILLSGQGGVFGDPFEQVKVERGSVHVSYYGGSGERWSVAHQFRFQDGGWFLIGVITQTSRTDGSDEGTFEDYNLLTGKMHKVTTDDQGKTRDKMIKRGKRKLVNLVDFDAAADQHQY